MEVMQINLITFEGVRKFKSVRRAIRRGNVSPSGVIYPKKPFNNRLGKELENKKRKIYESLKLANQRINDGPGN